MEWLLVVALATACRPQPAPVEYDLVEQFGAAKLYAETDRIDFGTREAREQLLDGWSDDEREPDQLTFTWALGDHSSLRLFVIEPRSITLILRCRALPTDVTSAQLVTVVVNGRASEPVRIAEDFAEYHVPVPAEAWIAGWNQIEFRYAHAHRPIDVIPGSDDTRLLSVEWDWLQLADASTELRVPRVYPSAEVPTLFIPFRTRVEYYLEIFPGTMLEVGQIERWGDGGGAPALHVEFELDGTGSKQVAALPLTTRGSPASQLALPVSSVQVARISLEVRSGESGSPDGAGLLLARPHLLFPVTPESRPATPSRPASPPRRPNIVFYLIDTLRADHLGCYGYEKPVSPNIDALAREATRFASASSQASWTRASVASLFTGQHPRTNGVAKRSHALSPAALTLAEMLARLGYETAALVTNGNVAKEFGMAQGFQLYDFVEEESGPLNVRAFAWLDRAPRDRPFFLYLHSLDPHAPYTPHMQYLQQFAPNVANPHVASMGFIEKLLEGSVAPESAREDLLGLYDVEIASNDESFGALLQKLRSLQLYDQTLIVLVSDHGEEFYDHGGWEHGHTLYAEQLHVPLVIKLPRGIAAGRTVSAPIELVDVLPTILEALDAEMPPGLEGQSLLPLMTAPEASTENARVAFADLRADRKDLESVVADDMKLIVDHSGIDPVRLFDLSRDPGELRNLAADRPIRVGYLRALLTKLHASAPPSFTPAKAVADETLLEQLKALGYAR